MARRLSPSVRAPAARAGRTPRNSTFDRDNWAKLQSSPRSRWRQHLMANIRPKNRGIQQNLAQQEQSTVQMLSRHSLLEPSPHINWNLGARQGSAEGAYYSVQWHVTTPQE